MGGLCLGIGEGCWQKQKGGQEDLLLLEQTPPLSDNQCLPEAAGAWQGHCCWEGSSALQGRCPPVSPLGASHGVAWPVNAPPPLALAHSPCWERHIPKSRQASTLKISNRLPIMAHKLPILRASNWHSGPIGLLSWGLAFLLQGARLAPGQTHKDTCSALGELSHGNMQVMEAVWGT